MQYLSLQEIPLKPEEGVVGWMDVDIDFLFNVDVHVIMVSPTFTLVISFNIATGNPSAR